MFVRFRGWLFFLLMTIAMTAAGGQAQTPATTTITDVVYRADGTPAAGTLLISWPAFSTASGQAVAAGTANAALGTGGALSVALVPNVGATPGGTFYTVVYQLNDGTVKTEYWVVPTNSPTTIAAVRTTLGTTSSAAQLASQQYVNTAIATKANDAVVVHLTGSESISGLKAFALAPSVPTPVLATDAANKAYVDGAVSGAGSGAFVSKAGDVMTGPLTLPGDPAAPNQAATQHYVSLGLASKADLNAGVVPSAELGSGTANGTTCLLGDGTWGACGSSSNAISIQSTPVDTTAPSDNQVITYVASAGKYEPRAGGGVTAGMQVIKYAIDFNWSQTPASDLSTAGAKTVSLSACPAGVTGSEPYYYVYISGTGTPEAALVTGGTCAGNGAAGTLQFVTVNAHSAGYALGSASNGVQEAVIAARFNPTNPTAGLQSGKVVVTPGEMTWYARVSIRASNLTLDMSGAIIDCAMNDTCLFAGNPTSSISYFDITIVNPRFRATIASSFPFLEVNAQKTRVLNLSTRTPLSGAYVSNWLLVDDDQAFLLDGLDTSLGQTSNTNHDGNSVLCNSTSCDAIIKAAPPSAANAVGWLKHLNIGAQCGANGVDWQSGNGLRISDSVIQGAEQYAVRTGGHGGFQGTKLENVYMEAAAGCSLQGIGIAGVINNSGRILETDTGGSTGPLGLWPQYANTGTTTKRYYIVAHHATFGPSVPLYAGFALTNGSGNITVLTPDVPGASTLDLLVVTDSGTPPYQAPFGTGNYAVVTGVTRASACTGGVCTFTDTQAAPSSYTVATNTYFPLLPFWPGNIVTTPASDTNAVGNIGQLITDSQNGIVNVGGTASPFTVINTHGCGNTQYMETVEICPSSSFFGTGIGFQTKTAMLLSSKTINNDTAANTKGVLNLLYAGLGPGHLITLDDSNPSKTLATSGFRPLNDPNDSFIGYDRGDGNPAHTGISFGAPVSLSNYIGNVGDGSNWLERLTASLKEFKTNVQMDGNLTVSGSITGNTSTATALAATPTQCSGSFATGIQANGNANCGTADVVQLAESAPPTGVANFGLFWFDTTCHCPKVIDNNGQAVQLGLTNVFNSDANGTNVANVLEQRNGTAPQELRIYGTYTDASNYERMRLGFDATDSYYYLGADALGTGTQRGLGFWLQGGLRWGIDPAFNLKPLTDNNRDLGASGLRIANGYFGTSLSSPAFWLSVPNASTTGTTINDLVKLTGDPATAVITATTDTQGVIGVVMGGAGTTGNALIATNGTALCAFDNATTTGDYVQISSTVAGGCHDVGAGYPASGQVIGQVMSTHGAAGAYTVFLFGTNTVAAAPTASPAFTGTPTAPTPSTSDNSTKIATTAYVQAQGFVTSDSTPWFTQPSAAGTVSFLTTSNVVKLFGVVYSGSTALVTTKVNYNVVTADNTSNTYDIGIVNSSGVVLAHIGATAGTTFAPSAGWKTLNWTGSATLTRGKYYLAITTNCTTSCAQIIGSSTGVGLTFAGGVQESVSSGGALSGTIAIPTDSYTATTIPTWAVQ